jgi:hypothetical protein
MTERSNITSPEAKPQLKGTIEPFPVSEEDWERFQKEIAETTPMTMEEFKKRYGVT